MDALQAAISKAQWKEIVTLTAMVNDGADEEGGGGGRDLQQQPQEEQVIALTSVLDEEHGGVQWNPIVAPRSAESGTTATNQSAILSHYLQTKPWILPMLNDTKRNELYFNAIERAVTKLNTTTNSKAAADSNRSASWNVMDLGCGTGLLGMMAAKHILSSQQEQKLQSDKDGTSLHVSMVDMSSEMVEIARRTVVDNNLDSVVKVHCGHSCEIQPLFLTQIGQEDPKQQSDASTTGVTQDSTCTKIASIDEHHEENSVINTLVVSELLESGLLGEGWLPAVRDALERHVHPKSSAASNVIAIPQGATVYVAAVEGDWIRNYGGPYDAAFLQSQQTDEAQGRNGAVGSSSLTLRPARGTYLTLHADKLLCDGRLRLLSEPMAVLHFDVMNSIHAEQKQRQCRIQVPITRSGRVDGILVWWILTLYNDPDDSCSQPLVYSMAPNSSVPEQKRQPWQDHWHQCLHLVETSTVVEAGTVQPLLVRHDDSRIYVEFGLGKTAAPSSTATTSARASTTTDAAEEKEQAAKRRCLSSEDSQRMLVPQTALISPSRAYQLNDGYRMSVLRLAIARAVTNSSVVNGKPINSMTVLDLSDFPVCAILAAQVGARNIYSLESGTSSHGGNNVIEICRVMAQMAKCTTEIKILRCHSEQLTLDLFQGSNSGKESDTTSGVVDICVAEPYYQVMEDWPLVQALNLYYMVRSMRKRGVLTDRTIMLPGAVRLVGCAIESAQLHSAYRPCGDDTESSMIHGIQHRVINQLLARKSRSEDGSKETNRSQYQYDLSLPMWQYDYTRLTPPVELAQLSYKETSSEASIQTTSRVLFCNKTGVCHAMMVWLEYGYKSTATTTTVDIPDGSCNQEDQTEQEDRFFLSTDNQSHRQLVQMLPEPVVIHEESDLELVCTCTIGGLQHQTHHLEIQIESHRSDQRDQP